MDRRQHERYNVEARLRFSWKTSKGTSRRGEGVLRNISGGGVFVVTTKLPPEGTNIQFNTSLEYFVAGSRLLIRGVAQVVRVALSTSAESRTGFGAAITALKLRNDEASE